MPDVNTSSSVNQVLGLAGGGHENTSVSVVCRHDMLHIAPANQLGNCPDGHL